MNFLHYFNALAFLASVSIQSEIGNVNIKKRRQKVVLSTESRNATIFCNEVWTPVEIDAEQCEWNTDCRSSKAHRADSLDQKKKATHVFGRNLRLRNGKLEVFCCRSNVFQFTECKTQYLLENRVRTMKQREIPHGRILVNVNVVRKREFYKSLRIEHCKISAVEAGYCSRNDEETKQNQDSEKGKAPKDQETGPQKGTNEGQVQSEGQQTASKNGAIGQGQFGEGVLTGLGIGLPLLLLLITTTTSAFQTTITASTIATTSTTTTTPRTCFDIQQWSDGGDYDIDPPTLKLAEGQTGTLSCLTSKVARANGQVDRVEIHFHGHTGIDGKYQTDTYVDRHPNNNVRCTENGWEFLLKRSGPNSWLPLNFHLYCTT